MPEMSPAAWLQTLERRLHDRWAKMAVYDAYYEGDHRLSFATAKFREAFGSLFAAISDNWCPIVVDSSVERLRVQGFRFGSQQDADDDAWNIWQANGLDAESNMVHTEAVKLGESYWLVQPGDVPKITSEHPSQVIVACAPGDRRTRLAALKKWVDAKTVYANVYLPDRVAKYQTEQTVGYGYGERNWRQYDVVPNPLGVVPVVPMRNNPSMLKGGRSDLEGGAIDVQNALNKILSDMLINSEYLAFPQRVLAGLEIPRDEQGNPKRSFELKFSQARALVFGDSEVKWGEFTAADIDNYVKAITLLTRHLTAQTRTPPHYVLGEIVNASGDALKAAETGLVSKVRDKMDPFGEGHEEAMRLAFKSIDRNDPRAEATDAETIWRDPESRSQAEIVDSVTKQVAIGLPFEVALEKMGYSPQEVDRILGMKAADDLLSAANPPPMPPTNGQVPSPQAQQVVASAGQ